MRSVSPDTGRGTGPSASHRDEGLDAWRSQFLVGCAPPLPTLTQQVAQRHVGMSPSRPASRRRHGLAPGPACGRRDDGEPGAGPRPGRRGRPRCARSPGARGEGCAATVRLPSCSPSLNSQTALRGRRSGSPRCSGVAARALKMHFCIPVSQQRPDALGGRYVLYSVYLDGFLFCRVRYSQLHRWNEQLRRVFGNCLPPFPPKYYLAMTTSMADARRDQLEQYLQNVTVDPKMLRSDVFVDFLKLVQLVRLLFFTKVIISLQNMSLS
nr:PREDICTED: uncharacterized protein LOC103555229 [Equus przewalskii]